MNTKPEAAEKTANPAETKGSAEDKPTIQTVSTNSAIPEAVLQAAQAQHKVAAAAQDAEAMQEDAVVLKKAPQVEEEPKLYVYDLTAESGARTHDLVDRNGVVTPYNFPDSRTPRAVPWSAGFRLVGVDGFKVYDAEGNLLESNKERDEKVTLKSTETIARYDELTFNALADRAKALKAPKELTSKEEIIKWLVAFNQEREDARQRADELGINKSLKELIEDAGGDETYLTRMDNDAIAAAVASGGENLVTPQQVAV